LAGLRAGGHDRLDVASANVRRRERGARTGRLRKPSVCMLMCLAVKSICVLEKEWCWKKRATSFVTRWQGVFHQGEP
jgi:hypothetical protein